MELVHAHGPLAVLARDHDRGLERGADGREVLGGVGLREGAADRAAVADHGVGDHVLGVGEERIPLGQQLGLEELAVARHRSDPDLAVLLVYVGEALDLVDVDQVLGVGEPQLHHRQQAVAAGDEHRLVPQLIQQTDRVVDAGGALVLEWAGHLHVS